MNIKKMIEGMYEDKITNLLDSGFELCEESENYTNTYKQEIVDELTPMVECCIANEAPEENELCEMIYDLDNVWRNAIFNIFKKYNISDKLLDESFKNPSKLEKSIYRQWDKSIN